MIHVSKWNRLTSELLLDLNLFKVGLVLSGLALVVVDSEQKKCPDAKFKQTTVSVSADMKVSKMQGKAVVVKCFAIPEIPSNSAERFGLTLIARWIIDSMDQFVMNQNGHVYYIGGREYRNTSELSFITGNNSSASMMKYTPWRRFVLGTQAADYEQPVLGLHASILWDTSMEGSTFECRVACGQDWLKRELPLSFPAKECNLQRYQFDYPCKYPDYTHLEAARTCVKVIYWWEHWDVAAAKCRYIHKGNLVRIENALVDKALSELLETLKEKLFQDGAWIGLQNRKLENLGAGLAGYYWLDDEETVKYSNWDPEMFLGYVYALPQACAVLKNRGFSWHWEIRDCFYDRYSYTCQKVSALDPGPPTLSVGFDSGGKWPVLGDELLANCTAFTTLGAELRFKVITPLRTIDIAHNDSKLKASFFLEEDGQFVETGDRCFPRSHASLRISLDADMFGVKLACCWTGPDSYTRCTQAREILMLYPPQHPLLKIQGSYSLVLGEFLSASCSVCVGTGGQQAWTLITVNASMVWTSQIQLTETIRGFFQRPGDATEKDGLEENNITTIVWTAKMDQLCGPYIYSTFRQRVSQALHGSVLICSSVNKLNEFVGTEFTIARSSVFTVLGKDETANVESGLLMIVLSILIVLLPCFVCVNWGVKCSKDRQTPPPRKSLDTRSRSRSFHSAIDRAGDGRGARTPGGAVKKAGFAKRPQPGRAAANTARPSQSVVASLWSNKRGSVATSVFSYFNWAASNKLEDRPSTTIM